MRRIDVFDLQQKLIDNYDGLITIMIHLGFDEESIKCSEYQHLITAKRPEYGADNSKGFLLYTNTLKWLYTTRNKSGNVFTLIMDLMRCSFSESLQRVVKWLDLDVQQTDVKLPFNGFYKKLQSDNSDHGNDLYIYDESLLPVNDSLSYAFYKDGIGFDVQNEFGVRYSHEDDATLIPTYDLYGNLVGCKARSNDPNCDYAKRWYAYLPYAKTKTIYGYHQNISHIQQKDTVIITESEKGVLQLRTFNCKVGLAIGGHNISRQQSMYIKSLLTKKIIIAFDQDLDEEEIRNEAEKLVVDNAIMHNKVGYMYDEDGLYLPIGSKASPSDYGIDTFKGLLKKKVRWL